MGLADVIASFPELTGSATLRESKGRTKQSAILALLDGRSAFLRHQAGRGTVLVISSLAAVEKAARRDGERDALGLDPGEGDDDPIPFDVRRGRGGPR